MLLKRISIFIVMSLSLLENGFAMAPKTPVANTKLGVVEITQPENFDRILALSDVHGMYPALVDLLQNAKILDSDLNWSGGKTLLIVTGDSIDKGPQSVDVLDLWIKLQSQAKKVGGDLIHLLGNHEAEFLADPSNKKARTLLAELKEKSIPLKELTEEASPRGKFLRSQALAARVGNWLFCHSGFFPEMKWQDFKIKAKMTLENGNYSDSFLLDRESILEAKKWEIDAAKRNLVEARLDLNQLTGVVFGHQPKALGITGKSGTSKDGRLIKIDNGMAPEAGSHSGSLLSFTQPSELNSKSIPHVLVIDSAGKMQSLAIESSEPSERGNP